MNEKVKQIISKRIRNFQFSSDKKFEELGFDSIDKIDIIMDLESAFNVTIPSNVEDQLTTAQQLSDYLEDITCKQN